MTAVDPELERAVADAVRAALERGAVTFYDVLESCEGADPKLVARVFASSGPPVGSVGAVARRETSELAALFPAADPVACQWWNTLDSVERLASRAYEAARPDTKTAFLGAPTIAYQFSRRAPGATVFDVDQHVLDTLSSAGGLTAVRYDVAESVPPEHVGQYHVVLLDPPWYPEIIRAFLSRALEMGAPGASVFCSIPPRLTRPGIVEERQALLRADLKTC